MIRASAAAGVITLHHLEKDVGLDDEGLLAASSCVKPLIGALSAAIAAVASVPNACKNFCTFENILSNASMGGNLQTDTETGKFRSLCELGAAFGSVGRVMANSEVDADTASTSSSLSQVIEIVDFIEKSLTELRKQAADAANGLVVATIQKGQTDTAQIMAALESAEATGEVIVPAHGHVKLGPLYAATLNVHALIQAMKGDGAETSVVPSVVDTELSKMLAPWRVALWGSTFLVCEATCWCDYNIRCHHGVRVSGCDHVMHHDSWLMTHDSLCEKYKIKYTL